MGRTIRCPECGELYQDLETIEDLRENDGICLVCNAPIEVTDWDRVLASHEDDDLDDVDAVDDEGLEADDDWQGDVEIDDDDDADGDQGFDEPDDSTDKKEEDPA